MPAESNQNQPIKPTHYEASRPVVNSLNKTTGYVLLSEAAKLDPEAVEHSRPFFYCGVDYFPVVLTASPTNDAKPTMLLPTFHVDELRAMYSAPPAPQQPKVASKVGHVLAGVAVGIVITLSAWSAGHESGMRAGVKAGVLAGARTVLAAELCDRAAEVCK